MNLEKNNLALRVGIIQGVVLHLAIIAGATRLIRFTILVAAKKPVALPAPSWFAAGPGLTASAYLDAHSYLLWLPSTILLIYCLLKRPSKHTLIVLTGLVNAVFVVLLLVFSLTVTIPWIPMTVGKMLETGVGSGRSIP